MCTLFLELLKFGECLSKSIWQLLSCLWPRCHQLRHSSLLLLTEYVSSSRASNVSLWNWRFESNTRGKFTIYQFGFWSRDICQFVVPIYPFLLWSHFLRFLELAQNLSVHDYVLCFWRFRLLQMFNVFFPVSCWVEMLYHLWYSLVDLFLLLFSTRDFLSSKSATIVVQYFSAFL